MNAKPIAYIMSRFPKLTETFILREMRELERQGELLLVFPLIHTHEPVQHDEVKQLKANVHFTSFISGGIIAAQWHYFKKSPRRFLHVLFYVLKKTWGSSNLFFGALGVFPKALYFARQSEKAHVKHIHAHFATHPALAALIISEFTGIQFSFTAHAHDIFIRSRLRMLAEKMKKAVCVVTVSHFNKQYLMRLCPGIPEKKIQVVRCGISCEQYRHHKEGASNKLFTILSVAALKPYKGLSHLINACALLASEKKVSFQCLIVGEGPERKRLEKLIEKKGVGDTIQLLGGQPHEKVIDLYARADLFVLPSVIAPNGQMEGVPVALMEAMASGVPVITSRLSGIPELVHDARSGILVSPGDERALADAIHRLFQEKEVREQMGHYAQNDMMKEFQLAANVSKLRTLFNTSFSNETKKSHDTIITWLKEVLATQGGPEKGNVIALQPLTKGHDSHIYAVCCHDENTDTAQCVLKLHTPAQGNPQEKTIKEYRLLESLWNDFMRSSDTLLVPKPIACHPELAAILMSKCAGKRLDHMLRWVRWKMPMARNTVLFDYMNKSGAWLRKFQEITQQDCSPTDVYTRIEKDFRDELAVCCQRGIDAALAQQLTNDFEKRKQTIFHGRHKVVGFHCDFSTYNIFVTREHLTVIDFEGVQDGLAYEDLGHFLAVLASTPAYHLGKKHYLSASRYFLEGYAPEKNINNDALLFFMMLQMIKIMAYMPFYEKPLRAAMKLKIGARWLEKEYLHV